MSVFNMHVHDMLERNRISQELIALYVHRTLVQAGGAIAGVFTVIFVYQHFNDSLWAVLAVFASIYAGFACIVPISVRFLSRLGTRSMMLLALPCAALGTAMLYNISEHGGVAGLPITASLTLFIVCMVLYKVLYWVPYHIDMSQLLDRSRRGFQLAFMQNTGDVNVAAMPFWGGLIVASLGFGWLFLFSIAFILSATLPLLWVSNRYERFEWGYIETFRQFFARHNRSLLFAYVGDGIQSGAQVVAWPLLVFLLLDGEYVALGVVAALTLFAILALRLIAGRFIDHGRKRQALTWGALLASTGWVLRMFATGPFTVVAVDTYHGFGRVVSHISVEAISYEQASDNGRFVDEFTVLKEIGLNVGRVLILAAVGTFAWLGGIYFGFAAGLLFAAFATLATTRLSRSVFLS